MMLNQQIHDLKDKVLSSVETYWGFVPPNIKDTLKLTAFTLWKVPMIAFLSPRVLWSSDDKMEIKIPLNYRSKNHLGSMYFGALAVGADLVVGTLALKHMESFDENIQLIFKDFKAEYLKRAEGDVHFICDKGAEIEELVRQAAEGDERVHLPVEAYATVPSISDEVVAKFVLTLSLKKK
ncbi:MAG: DUF4442 domain-containing protein [Bdellovibrionales bacterium]|nr:DUF4442 domain-containing protein [Bdellovibrionales bacterium]